MATAMMLAGNGARASGVPVIMVRLGYGVTAVQTALEEYFGRQAAN